MSIKMKSYLNFGVNIVDHKSSINHARKYLFYDHPIKIAPLDE